MGKHFQDAKQWYLMDRSLQFCSSGVYTYNTYTHIYINCFVSTLTIPSMYCILYIILFYFLFCFVLFLYSTHLWFAVTLPMNTHALIRNKFWFVLWRKEVFMETHTSWGGGMKTWNQNIEQYRRRIRVGPPEHECLKFTLMLMMMMVVVVVLLKMIVRGCWYYIMWLRAAACHVIWKICSFEPPRTVVAKQSLENGSDEKRKVSFLWTKTFGLFGIKITAQLPIDDSGLCFISVSLLLLLLFIEPKELEEDKKIHTHTENFLFAWFYFILF